MSTAVFGRRRTVQTIFNKENFRLKRLLADAELEKVILSGGCRRTPLSGAAQLLGPAKRQQAVEHIRIVLGRNRVSERRPCRVIRQSSWLWKKPSMAFFHESEPQKAKVFEVRNRRIQRRMTLSTGC